MNKLDSLRRQIDEADNQIITLLAKRFSIVQKIGAYKKKHELPALDKKRFENILQTRIGWGNKKNLPPALVKKIFHIIHEFSLIVESVYKKS